MIKHTIVKDLTVQELMDFRETVLHHMRTSLEFSQVSGNIHIGTYNDDHKLMIGFTGRDDDFVAKAHHSWTDGISYSDHTHSESWAWERDEPFNTDELWRKVARIPGREQRELKYAAWVAGQQGLDASQFQSEMARKFAEDIQKVMDEAQKMLESS